LLILLLSSSSADSLLAVIVFIHRYLYFLEINPPSLFRKELTKDLNQLDAGGASEGKSLQG
jgi:hypothetical protein